MSQFDSPETLVQELLSGRMVLLVDDEDRENEGDLVLAADFVTPEAINFMAKEARGLVCLALEHSQIDRLKLPMMVREENNLSPNRTAFTVSIEASSGVTTGISAADRAHTIRVASRPSAVAGDVRSPGHIFPLRAQSGGVLKRAGHTEGSVDLVRLAGLNPAAVICEVMNEDGTMARVPDLIDFSRKHQIKIGTIVDLIEYRLKREQLVQKTVEFETASSWGPLTLSVFKSRVDGEEHLVVTKGSITEQPVLVRVQVQHTLKSLLAILQGEPSPLRASLEMVAQNGGVLVLLSPGGSQLTSQLQMLGSGRFPFPMDERNYGTGAQILRALGVKKIRLLSTHPVAPVALKGFDLEIVEWVKTPVVGDEDDHWPRSISLQ